MNSTFCVSDFVLLIFEETCLASLSLHTFGCHTPDGNSQMCTEYIPQSILLRRLLEPFAEVLHVGTEPGLFHGTLYDNLIFGVAEGMTSLQSVLPLSLSEALSFVLTYRDLHRCPQR